MFRKGNFANYDLDGWNDPKRLPLGIAGLVAFCFGVVVWVMGMVQTWVSILRFVIWTFADCVTSVCWRDSETNRIIRRGRCQSVVLCGHSCDLYPGALSRT